MGRSDLLFAFVAGLGLGAFFFSGLWWSTRRGLASTHPAAWFMGSFVIRTGITLVGFYVLSNGRWERLTACLLGFVTARMAAKRLAGRQLK